VLDAPATSDADRAFPCQRTHEGVNKRGLPYASFARDEYDSSRTIQYSREPGMELCKLRFTPHHQSGGDL
jgi:hypothetical protein